MMNASILKTVCCMAACLAMAGCGKKFNPASGGASPAQVIETGNAGWLPLTTPNNFRWWQPDASTNLTS